MRFVLFISILVLSHSVQALSSLDRQKIEERIKPVGQVHLAQQIARLNSPRESGKGKAIFEQYCSICHQGGLAGAPKLHDKQDWKPRLDKSTLSELIASANKGLNAMPVKGTCKDCTDEDLKNAIQYMLPKL
ncbi:MAG: cytochrome c5 family protein [Tatlockia sp.]|nr:cytochrome c5 family protein [Tatlockia sp.]